VRIIVFIIGKRRALVFGFFYTKTKLLILITLVSDSRKYLKEVFRMIKRL
jgi:hypothetical protein